MFNRSAPILVLLGFLTACDSGASNFPDGGGPPEPVAITERASRGTHSCRVIRDRTDHSPRIWGQVATALVTTSGGKAYLARRENMSTNPFEPPTTAQFLVSSFDAAGTFGTPVTIPAAVTQLGDVAGAPRGDGFALVWVEGTRLRFAAFDAAGAITIAPRDVIDGVQETVTPRMAAGPDGGFGVVYDPEGANGVRSVYFLVLAADGALRHQPRRLDGPATGMNYTPTAPAITGGPSGYTMMWADPAAPDGAIDFARADAAGVETLPRRRIAGPGPGSQTGRVGWLAFAPAVHGLLEIDGVFLTAWVETQKGTPNPSTGGGRGAWSVVRLARVDGTGVLLGPPAALRAPADSIDEVEPSLVRLGDAVAVLWGRGNHIYLCGGCVPDHRVDLLLVDPADLTPLSQVVSITNGGGVQAGGILRRQLAVLGKSLLMAYRLTFHVHNTPGSATFECDRVK
jgi:hypothetical protein